MGFTKVAETVFRKLRELNSPVDTKPLHQVKDDIVRLFPNFLSISRDSSNIEEFVSFLRTSECRIVVGSQVTPSAPAFPSLSPLPLS